MFYNNNKCCQNAWQQECCMSQDPCMCDPIVEQPVERCIERNICDNIPLLSCVFQKISYLVGTYPHYGTFYYFIAKLSSCQEDI